MVALVKALYAAETWRHVGYALLSGVWLVPLIVALLVNQHLESPAITFGGIAAYFAAIAVVGWKFERWRTLRLLRMPMAGPRRGRIGLAALYGLVSLPVGSLAVLLPLAWIIVSVRNVFLYPIVHRPPYPDPSWGGPTVVGAIAVHWGGGVVIMLGGPWAIKAVSRFQGKLARSLLVSRTTADRDPDPSGRSVSV